MVRRLIEDQDIGATGLQQRQTGAGPLTWGQLVNLAIHVVGAQTELGQQGADIGGRP